MGVRDRPRPPPPAGTCNAPSSPCCVSKASVGPQGPRASYPIAVLPLRGLLAPRMCTHVDRTAPSPARTLRGPLAAVGRCSGPHLSHSSGKRCGAGGMDHVAVALFLVRGFVDGFIQDGQGRGVGEGAGGRGETWFIERKTEKTRQRRSEPYICLRSFCFFFCTLHISSPCLSSASYVVSHACLLGAFHCLDEFVSPASSSLLYPTHIHLAFYTSRHTLLKQTTLYAILPLCPTPKHDEGRSKGSAGSGHVAVDGAVGRVPLEVFLL